MPSLPFHIEPSCCGPFNNNNNNNNNNNYYNNNNNNNNDDDDNNNAGIYIALYPKAQSALQHFDISDRPSHRGLRPILFPNSVWVLTVLTGCLLRITD